MAYLFRSIVAIGVIAFHSPVHQQDKPAPAIAAAATSTPPGLDAALGSIATARDAAAAIANLDPQTRQAVLAMLTASIARGTELARPAQR